MRNLPVVRLLFIILANVAGSVLSANEPGAFASKNAVVLLSGYFLRFSNMSFWMAVHFAISSKDARISRCQPFVIAFDKLYAASLLTLAHERFHPVLWFWWPMVCGSIFAKSLGFFT
jgi:hypothetical protein